MAAIHERPFRERLRRAYYQGLLRPVPSSLFNRVLMRRCCGYWPDLARPRSFNEHLQRYKLTARDPRMATAADKLLLRGLVRDRLGDGYSAALVAEWTDIGAASCRGLPPDYVVKASHGSGLNHVVQGGDLTDDALRRMLSFWNGVRYYWRRREWAYRPLTPRFFAEEYLGEAGRPPDDFKAFVFGGRVQILQLDADRFTGHRRALFDREWRPIAVEYRFPGPAVLPPRPAALAEMIDVAERLGREFEFVRVDMYALPRRLVVGEMTFYPEGGFGRFGTRAQDDFVGSFWNAA